MTHGGKRTGAGRKRKLVPIADPQIAIRVLAMVDEEQLWLELLGDLTRVDDRLRFDVMKYLTDRRDGRPLQQIRTASPNEKQSMMTVDIATVRNKLFQKLMGETP